MFEHIDVQDAIKRAIQTEKKAMIFYRMAARHMKNDEARRLFEMLASEELVHAKQFYSLYRRHDIPDFDAFMDSASEAEKDWLSSREKALLSDLGVRKAMELAMHKELKLEKQLREIAANIKDPEVRSVFEENAKSTNHHYQLIESEYAHLMGMVHETDIDTYVRE
ncbi:MAG: ferritin [Desulfuromonadales bacterium C00003094]|jgi:rubrerythrin|nr:MAG: ferritin [Desulfuromonadales bacterium C00003094]OEU74466.1 MAG: ferritin [Desulfuromonadales bacterium C00003107]